MTARYKLVLSSAVLIVTMSGAIAGPCSTVGKDAGSGSTPGYTGQTTGMGSADTKQHPPTDTMNRAVGDQAASSQDAQKQMQGQPTAAQQAEGTKGSSTQTADQGC